MSWKLFLSAEYISTLFSKWLGLEKISWTFGLREMTALDFDDGLVGSEATGGFTDRYEAKEVLGS